MNLTTTQRANDQQTLDWNGVIAFIAVAFVIAWTVASPLWISGAGLQTFYAPFLIPLIMFAPAISAFIVARWVSPETDIKTATGLRMGPAKIWPRFWLFSWFGIPALVLASLALSAVFGLYHADLENFSGLQSMLEQSDVGKALLNNVSVKTLVALQIGLLLVAPIMNAVFAFGEEWGWRGYLLGKLLPLGQWPALLISGGIWGLWHMPIILLGYNYPLHPHLGWLYMLIFCVLLGILFGWTRLATGSVWPAVIAHGALNGSAGAVNLFMDKNYVVDTAQAGITGWVGWLLMAGMIIFLVMTRRLPVKNIH